MRERYLSIPDPSSYDYSRSYAETVQFFGKERSHAEITEEKRRFFRRWTEHSYALRTGTLVVTPQPGGVRVGFEYDWRVENAREIRSGRGSATLELADRSNGELRIVREDGEGLSRDVRQKPGASEAAVATLDGNWYSAEWKYGYRLRNGEGRATHTNSSKFAVGDVIIRIRSTGPRTFEGEQIYRDGTWNRIAGRLGDDGRLHIDGARNVSWTMSRGG